jgi:hypothetical protein
VKARRFQVDTSTTPRVIIRIKKEKKDKTKQNKPEQNRTKNTS